MASAANKKKVEEQNLKTLRELTSLEYNKKCLECSQRGITYADMNTSGFVCVQCSGYLRGLNPPHRVKSISMTTFSEAEIETLKKGGNESSRKVWLGKWNPKRDREPDKSDENAFKQYLISKYERRSWYRSPSEPTKEDTGKTETKPEPKILPPPSSKTTTTERPRGASQPVITAQRTHSPASQASSLPPATTNSKPKMDLLGELEGDPFAPKQPPVGGVSVLPQIPQGGVPLAAANSPKKDEFGAFTGATSSGSLAPSSLTSLIQTSSDLSKSDSDKYAALASLDQTLRGLKVKDEPPPQPVPVPVSQTQSQPFGNFGGGGTNPFGASPGSAQAVSNPFMAAGSPGQHQQQHIIQQPSVQGFGGQQHRQSLPQGYPGQQQVPAGAQGFGGQQQSPAGVQGFGGQQQRPPGAQGFGGQQQRPPGAQALGGQQQVFQGSGFAGKPQGFGQPQPQQFGAFGQQQPAVAGSPASNPYMHQQQWGQAQAQGQGQMQPGSSFGSIQQPQGVPGQQSQWRPQQGQQQWGGAQMGPGAQFGTQQTGFGGAQQSAFGGGVQQPAGFGGAPQQQSGGFGAQKSQQFPGQQQQQYGGFVSAQPQVPQQGSTSQFNWGASTATTPASQTRTGSIPSSVSGPQSASVSGWNSSVPASSSNQADSSLGWSSGLEKPAPQSTWGMQAQSQQQQQSQPGSTWSSSIGGGGGGMPQQQNTNWGVNPGMTGGSGGQMNWGSGGGFGGMQPQPQQGFMGGGVQQGSTANPFAATSQSTTNPFL